MDTDTAPQPAQTPQEPQEPPRIVVVGAGYVGMHTARRLQRRLRAGEASVTVVDPRSYMTYQPFLPEAAAGSLEPRHVVAPLRSVLDRCRVLTSTVSAIDTSRRRVRVSVPDRGEADLDYDYLVVAPGSVSKTLPVPGLADRAVGFTTLGEAIYLRNLVLSRLDLAASTTDPALRRRLLTYLFVGGGYAGVEAFGELEEMTRFAVRRYYPDLDERWMRWLLVEAADRIMPEVSGPLAEYTVSELRGRGVEVRLQTTVETMTDGHVVLSDGTEFDADTIVWTTGVSAHPLLADSDLPTDDRGRVRCRATLAVEGQDRVFAAGDSAAVPDLTSDDPGATCAPSAQHAVRQARQLADNLLRTMRGQPLEDYRHAYAGSVASLGLHEGVAEIHGRKLKGWPAWALHRVYHLSKMPTGNRKARILIDWILTVPFRRQVVALGELHEPRSAFAREADRQGADRQG
ncbi:MAG TPA: NAD(P)/FAD-dependent oxidoreductase [Nocardioidaceae bacterium]|nr:NAD(P)/FAD-dependent oxidoreductase [Nocardioidaceae bacterium]